MNKYCFDTNIITLLTGTFRKSSDNFIKQSNLKSKLSSISMDYLFITEFTKLEILYGINNYKKSKLGKSYDELDENHKIKLQQFRKENIIISKLNLTNLDEYSLGHYKDIITTQTKKGFNQKDHCDYFIASICIANNLVIVTNNEKDFNKIDGLKIENWTKI
ncbi:MAG: type II toxin-antitoxin system VapC family toxin [Candidatus Gracilibacteria bacterium]|nr:type II toxin-antitoxin system VapC family toxin [Candidatus Gracilibacteria bacterium]